MRERYRNLIAGVSAIVVVGGAALIGRANIPGFSELPRRIPIVDRLIPGSPTPEQEQTALTDIELLMKNPDLLQWRNQLSNDTIVTIRDYGENRRTGRVISRDGIRGRSLPDTTQGYSFVGESKLAWGATPDWRFQITVESKGSSSDFVMLYEHGYPETFVPDADGSIRVVSVPNPNYITGGFAALQTSADGPLIDANPDLIDPQIVTWKKS